jgi:uncharacterized protein YoxC
MFLFYNCISSYVKSWALLTKSEWTSSVSKISDIENVNNNICIRMIDLQACSDNKPIKLATKQGTGNTFRAISEQMVEAMNFKQLRTPDVTKANSVVQNNCLNTEVRDNEAYLYDLTAMEQGSESIVVGPSGKTSSHSDTNTTSTVATTNPLLGPHFLDDDDDAFLQQLDLDSIDSLTGKNDHEQTPNGAHYKTLSAANKLSSSFSSSPAMTSASATSSISHQSNSVSLFMPDSVSNLENRKQNLESKKRALMEQMDDPAGENFDQVCDELRGVRQQLREIDESIRKLGTTTISSSKEHEKSSSVDMTTQKSSLQIQQLSTGSVNEHSSHLERVTIKLPSSNAASSSHQSHAASTYVSTAGVQRPPSDSSVCKFPCEAVPRPMVNGAVTAPGLSHIGVSNSSSDNQTHDFINSIAPSSGLFYGMQAANEIVVANEKKGTSSKLQSISSIYSAISSSSTTVSNLSTSNSSNHLKYSNSNFSHADDKSNDSSSHRSNSCSYQNVLGSFNSVNSVNYNNSSSIINSGNINSSSVTTSANSLFVSNAQNYTWTKDTLKK